MPIRLLHQVQCSTHRRHRRVRTSIRSKRVSAGTASDASFVGLGLDHRRLGFKKPSFTILTGLAAYRTRASSSLAAFAACSFPPHLLAQGKPRDLRDFTPIPADNRLYCAPLNSAPDVPSGQYMASGFCFPSIQQRQQRTGAHFQTMPTEKPHLP